MHESATPIFSEQARSAIYMYHLTEAIETRVLHGVLGGVSHKRARVSTLISGEPSLPDSNHILAHTTLHPCAHFPAIQLSTAAAAIAADRCRAS